MMPLLGVVVALLLSLLVMWDRRDGRRSGPQGRDPKAAPGDGQFPASGSCEALDVAGRIAELEREFGSLPDRQLRDRGTNG